MLRLFYGNQSYALFLAPVLVVFYAVLNAFTAQFLPQDNGIIGLGFWGNAQISNPLIGKIIAPTLIMISGAVMNVVYNRNEFLDRNTFLPVLLYITSSSFFPHFYTLNGFGIALFLLVMGLVFIFRLNQNDDGRSAVFNASILIGLGMTCYPPLIILFPPLFFIVWVFRPFVFRESLLLILGSATPFLYAWAFLYLTDRNLSSIVWSTSSLSVGRLTVITVSSGIFLFLLLSLPAVLQTIQRGTVRLRKLFTMLFLLGFFTLAIVAVDYFYFHHAGSGGLILIPLMFVIPYAFGQRKLRTESEWLYYVFLGISVSNFFLSKHF
jgi:hypothetical protein